MIFVRQILEKQSFHWILLRFRVSLLLELLMRVLVEASTVRLLYVPPFELDVRDPPAMVSFQYTRT